MTPGALAESLQTHQRSPAAAATRTRQLPLYESRRSSWRPSSGAPRKAGLCGRWAFNLVSSELPNSPVSSLRAMWGIRWRRLAAIGCQALNTPGRLARLY